MSGLWFFHILLLGLWGGCVAVEMTIELASRGHFDQKKNIARLHYYIDCFVEIPILFLVTLTGLMLLDLSKMHGLYRVKIIIAFVPVIANVLCLIPVFRRKDAALAGNEAAVDYHTKLIYLAFYTGITFGLVRMGIGLYVLGLI